MRSGMHFRWNFEAENGDFLAFQTQKMLPPGIDVTEIMRQAHNQMRGATAKFGVNPQTSSTTHRSAMDMPRYGSRIAAGRRSRKSQRPDTTEKREDRMTCQPVTLYGVPHSLYTGRARSYLIKADIAYREQAPNTEHYQKTVVPLAGGRRGLPTLECPDGRVIRDGAAIIDHFEEETGHRFSPKTPKHRFFSRLFDVIGAEGFLRPAMHYRWNFETENLDYLNFHFEMLTPRGDVGVGMARKVADQMRRATVGFGVTPQTRDLVEQLYAEQLGALDRHFAAYPYVLGGRPCIGDFGLIAPLFGHLGRDPKPLSLMLTHGMHVFRWVERMNRRDADLVEFGHQGETYLDADEIPNTLTDLLRVMAEDFVPETLAAADTINAWIAQQGDLAPGTECARAVGLAAFELRGTAIGAIAQPYRFYLLKRAQDAYAALEKDDQQAVKTILDACAMTPVLSATLTRGIGRKDNLEVWL